VGELARYLLAPKKNVLAEVELALVEVQPSLRVVSAAAPLAVEGNFVIRSSEGPIDAFAVRIVLDFRYPDVEPSVFETANRIPRTVDRHVNVDGSCCLTVWESWLVISNDLSFRAFLEGPMQEFFLNQFFFEKTGKWRLGERSHGFAGVIEAFADVLGIRADKDVVVRYLRSIAGKPKGHLACPCGSGELLRRCHQGQLHGLYARIGAPMARRMLGRLRQQA
jgi:hypothetical protein